MADAHRDREPDPEFIEDPGGEGRRPTSHLRSREEYVRGLRETWTEWLPGVPVPPDWREGGTVHASEQPAGGENQKRVQKLRNEVG